MPRSNDLYWLEDIDLFDGGTGVEGVGDDDELGVLSATFKTPFRSLPSKPKPKPSASGSRSRGWGRPIVPKPSSGRSTPVSRAIESAKTGELQKRVADISQQRAANRASEGSQTPNELLIRALTAQNMIRDMTKPPKVTARRSTGSADSRLAGLLADAVDKKLGGGIASINSRLALAQNQREATSEHLSLNNKTAFRKKVLADLLRISANLPANHPTRQRIRRVGLMSGLL